MKNQTTENLSKIKLHFLLFPTFTMLGIIIFLILNNVKTSIDYVNFQKDFFILLNQKVSDFPFLLHNLTQIGDAFIFLTLVSFLYFYFPKVWEALISASLISLIFSSGLKKIIDVPRPATIIDNHLFQIVGEPAVGYSSLPSGHSITFFTVFSVLFLAFSPKKYKILWLFLGILIGYFFSFTRVGVGAHFPFDVIFGGLLGMISGILGIFISQKTKFFSWISCQKFLLFFILLFLGSAIFIIFYKIPNENLPIFYFSLFSLIFSLFVILKNYAKLSKK